jgi:hypothetical protein
MMRTFCVFGEYALDEAAALGLDGIRFDVPAEGALEDVVQPFVGHSVAACFLLHDPARIDALLTAIEATGLDACGCAIEVYNEPPDLDDVQPDEYVDGVLSVWEACDQAGFAGTVIAGAQRNLSWECLRWYRLTVPHLPESCTVAWHDYPYGLQYTDRPWPPAVTHDENIESLRAITGSRPLVCSEMGRHMAPEQTGHPPVLLTLTEAWIEAFYVDRLRWLAETGHGWTAIYQWQDDPLLPGQALGLYGLHAVDGRVKQQAAAIQRWRWTPPGAHA